MATDAAGNSTTASFTVFVMDASSQLDDTIQLINGWNLPRGGAGLVVRLFVARQLLRLGHPTPACALIAGSMHQVRVMTGRALTSEQAFLLLTRLARIRSVAGC